MKVRISLSLDVRVCQIPIELLDMSDEDLIVWIEVEVERQLEAQRVNKLAEKENIKEQIKRLQKQLEQ